MTETHGTTPRQGREELRVEIEERFRQIAGHAVANQLTPSDTLREIDRATDAIMSLIPPAGLPVEVSEGALEAARVAFKAFSHGTDEDFVGCLRGAINAACAIMSVTPPAGLLVEVSEESREALSGLKLVDGAIIDQVLSDVQHPVAKDVDPDYAEHIMWAIKCAVDARPVKVRAINSLPSWDVVNRKKAAGERLTALEEFIYEQEPADDYAADLFRDLL